MSELAHGDKRVAEDVGGGAAKKANKGAAPCFDTDLLRLYYARLFPYDSMFKWLSYGSQPDAGGDYFLRREFSFTMADDVYIRYLTFRDAEELRREVTRRQPHKIDIGPVYSLPAKNHSTVKAGAFVPVERELVFDVDLDDYKDVRVGVQEGDPLWTRHSWLYMALAIKVVDRALREDFGFRDILWVFSGRRGVHCWVCDAAARALEDRERSAIVNYLHLIQGENKVALSDPLHPSVQAALPILEAAFEPLVCSPEGQDFLADAPRWDKVLAMLPEQGGLAERLREAWAAKPASSLLRWQQLKANVREDLKKAKGKAKYDLQKVVEKIVITYCYPRLDVNVSTHRNHLLKSPFVIHPKTGKVCVPIVDVANCDKFDPDAVPTLATLVKELDDPAKEGTAMAGVMDNFDRRFLAPLYKALKRAEDDKQNKLAAERGEW